MAATITAENGAGSTSPIDVLFPYEPARQSRNVFTDLIGGGTAVSLVAPRLRAGRLRLLYEDETAANDSVLLHTGVTPFVLDETEHPIMNMRYVLDGDVTPAPEQDTRGARWFVTVGFREISGT